VLHAQREDHYCPEASCAGLVLALATVPPWMTCHDQMSDRHWIQTDPKKGFFVILRLYSPLEPFFTKEWRPSEIELVQ
jgi:hypothetical protein